MLALPKPSEVLSAAANAARIGDVILTRHAEDQMDARSITIRDVLNALQTATAARYDDDRRTWRLTGGVDLDGEETRVVICTPNPGVVVVTAF